MRGERRLTRKEAARRTLESRRFRASLTQGDWNLHTLYVGRGPTLERGYVTKRRLVKAVAAGAVLFVLLMTSSACPDGTPMHQAMHGSRDLPPQTPVVTEASEVTIEIAAYDFTPRDVTVLAGATVTWSNRDVVPHDATEVGKTWTTGLLEHGRSRDLDFSSPGKYEYFCTIHPSMRARIAVL